MKQQIIIFEGVDKSGKTTLLNKFNKETNFKYWVMDRSIISSLVYNELFKRNDEDYYISILETMLENFDILFVYCYADIKDINERLYLHNESLPKELSRIEKVQKLYKEYLNGINLPTRTYIELNTSQLSVDECIEKIKESL
jgi:thymidylate kinase